MPKEVVLTALGNRIEYATTDGKGLITGERKDITDEAISAVYAHLKNEHGSKNKDGKGYGVKFEDGSRLLYIAPHVDLHWNEEKKPKDADRP